MKKELKIKNTFTRGSALILSVVLTSLLAIVAVVFVMLARVDKISTSAIAENKQLNLAVDSVIARICDEVAWDTPSLLRGEEYYDYPGYTRAPGVDGTLFTPNDIVTGDLWLASLEPERNANGTPLDLTDDIYYWPQISDIYEVVPGSRVGLLEGYGVGDWREASGFRDKVQPHNLRAQIIPEANSVSGAMESVPPNRLIDFGGPADADGDGVADSRWVKVPDMSSKGRDIYAAVRVVDNGAMLNVNTGYKFDPNNPGFNGENIDGSSQMHINLAALSQRSVLSSLPSSLSNGTVSEAAGHLQYVRCGYGAEPNDVFPYERNVIWRYNQPAGSYTPFDISDELKLRNRYILCYNKITTRIEKLWTCAYEWFGFQKQVPYVSFSDWFYLSNNSEPDVRYYNYAHISTTYNMDRIIDPDGRKMFNVNRIDPVAEPNVIIDLYRTIRDDIGNASLAAQIAANIKDYGDSDSDVTTVYDLYDPNGEPNRLGNPHYGFERPGIYISELVHKVVRHPRDPNKYYRSYAIELRKSYAGANPDWWQVVIEGPSGSFGPINVTDFGQDASRYRVIVFEDPNASLASEIAFTDSPGNFETGVDPNVILRWDPLPTADANSSYNVYFADNNSPGFIGNFAYNNTSYYPGPLGPNTPYFWRIDDVYPDVNGVNQEIGSSGVWQFTTWSAEPNSIYEFVDANDPPVFDLGTTISLNRQIRLPNGSYIYIPVDAVPLPPDLLPPWLVDPNEGFRSFKRDVSGGFWVKRIWDYVIPRPPSLGNRVGHYFAGDPNFVVAAGIDPNPIQAHVPNYFNNIGEIGKVLRKSGYVNDLLINPLNVIGPFDNELTARLDLRQPRFQEFFKYLTRFDPTIDDVDNDGDGFGWGNDPNVLRRNDPDELKVPGRININTAPWYVMAQLPWVSAHTPNYDLARAIADYRAANGPFTSIGELNRIADPNFNRSIDYYWRDGVDQLTFPDLTAGGGRALGDGVVNDFEERDLVFARISDLVTVRSDVFTAYILVRIGTDGPQKRVIAILDRSDAYTPAGSVRIRALHPVPDPR